MPALAMMSNLAPAKPQPVSITPLLKRLWPDPSKANVTASEIALALSHIFTDQLSLVQTGALLTALHFTGLDRRADVIAKCAEVMQDAAAPVDRKTLEEAIRKRSKRIGNYHGGLVSHLFYILLVYSCDSLNLSRQKVLIICAV